MGRRCLGAGLLFALWLLGCQGRIALYSPRLSDSPAHRAASSNQVCLECHAVAEVRGHQPDDDCRRCHVYCPSCRERGPA